MTERRYEEKEEKQEKENEKQEEKNWEEKWRRDPLSAIAWAGILIWAGLALLAESLGFLARFRPLHAWTLIFTGAGLIVILEAFVRLLVPEYRRPVTGSIIFGLILLGIGLGNLIGGWGTIWALVLIALGMSMLIRGFVSHR
ncbi:MAG: hypothetical protein NUW24_08660 [Anaerolineae bacterium]|jgi:hypothetical protein|nr:hypothetical protein [Anaerolineae bacterium]MDH7475273.1 hypothetical protein [Anaerolineae bacterium]